MPNRTFWRRIANYIFGYDFFVSYSWEDGRHYALELTQALESRGFECFLDDKSLSRGDNWRTVVRGAIARTSQLVLVGTPGAFRSEPVIDEVRSFSASGRRIVPIYFGDALELTKDRPEFANLIPAEVLSIYENRASLNCKPSEEVITALQQSFGSLRQSTKRIRLVAGVAAIFIVLSVIATTFGFLAEHQRRRAVAANQEAERQKNAALILLAESYFAQAAELIDRDQSAAGLAYLSQSLVLNPGRAAARSLLATSLIYRKWPCLRSFDRQPGRQPVAMSADAKTIAARTSQQSVTITTGAGSAAGSTITLPYEPIKVLLSPNGKLLLTIHKSHSTVSGFEVKLWDVKEGTALAEHAFEGELDSIRFDEDSRVILTSFAAAKTTSPISLGVVPIRMSLPALSTVIVIVNPALNPDAEPQSFTVPNRVSYTAVDRNGSALLLVSRDGTVSRSELPSSVQGATGATKISSFEGLERILTIDSSRDGRYLLVVNQAHECELLRADASPLTKAFRKPGIISAHFSAGDTHIVGRTADGVFRFWKLDGSSAAEPIVIGPSAVDANITDEDNVVVISQDSVSEWALPKDGALDTPLEPAGRLVYAATFTADSSSIRAQTAKNGAEWDASNGIRKSDVPMPEIFDDPLEYHHGANQQERSAALATFVGAVGLAVDGSTVTLPEAQNRGANGTSVIHAGTVNSAQFSPDGERIVTASNDETVGVWDSQTGRPLGSRLVHSAPVWSASFSPDGQRIVSVTADGIIRTWDIPEPSMTETSAIQDLAVVFGGLKISDNGAIVPLSLSDRWHAIEIARNAKVSSPMSKVFKWLLTAPDRRGLSPFSQASDGDRSQWLDASIQCHYVFDVRTRSYTSILQEQQKQNLIQNLLADPLGVLSDAIVGWITQSSSSGPPMTKLNFDSSEDLAKALDLVGEAKVETQPQCAWTAKAGAPWIELSPAEPSGRGSGRFKFLTMKNALSEPRSDVIEVMGQKVTISQTGRSANAPENE